MHRHDMKKQPVTSIIKLYRIMKNMKIFIILIIFSFSIIKTSFAQECCVLLGFRHDEQLSEPLPYGETKAAALQAKYRTLWVCLDEKDSISIIEIDDLIVPRKDRFWKITIKRLKVQNWIEDFIVSTPITENHEAPVIDSLVAAVCEGNRRLSLIFIGSDYLSYEGGSDGYCQGAAHPWHVNYLRTIAVDAPQGDGIDISSVLGPEAKTALLQGADKFLSRRNDEILDTIPDERNWGLIRRRGQWILRGQLDYSSEVYRGQFAHFNIPFPTPQSLVGYDSLSVNWQKIKELEPNARDAVSSPGKKLLIILTKHKLTCYQNSRPQPIRELALLPNEFLIMAQSAADDDVSKWDTIIRNYAGHEFD